MDNPDALAREWYEHCQSIDLRPRAAALRGRTSDALSGDPPGNDDASVIAHDERVENELGARYWRPSS